MNRGDMCIEMCKNIKRSLLRKDGYVKHAAAYNLVVCVILLVDSQRNAVGGGGHLHSRVGDTAVILAIVCGYHKQTVGKLMHCLVIHTILLAAALFFSCDYAYYTVFLPDFQVFIDTYFHV